MAANFFTWDPAKFSVDVAQMDQEHQTLIGIMNKLFQKAEAKAPKNEILVVMKELANYTKKHFTDEEAFFDKLGNYPHSAAHKRVHQDLLTRVGESIAAYEKGTNPIVSPEFFQFLKVWLAAHICGVDKKYGDAAKAAKAS